MTTTTKENTSMIPTSGNWVAQFKNDAGDIVYTLKVEAWSDEGDALVVVKKTGKLQAASTFTNFDGVYAEEGPVNTLVPGQGWTVEHHDNDGGTWSNPVVAFGFKNGNYAAIFTTGSDGLVLDDEEIDGVKVHLVPPGGWPAYINATEAASA